MENDGSPSSVIDLTACEEGYTIRGGPECPARAEQTEGAPWDAPAAAARRREATGIASDLYAGDNGDAGSNKSNGALPVRCGLKFPVPPEPGCEWEQCCLAHHWYDPKSRHIRNFRNPNLPSDSISLYCMTCGDDSDYTCKMNWEHPGARLTWAFHFCDKVCKMGWELRMPGTGTKLIRDKLKVRDKETCCACRRVGRPWEAAHIRAVKDGGGCCDINNYKTLCKECHAEETRSVLRRKSRRSREEELPEDQADATASSKLRRGANVPSRERKRKEWDSKMVGKLQKAVAKHGKGNWRRMIDDPEFDFGDRTNVNLKDKVRNLEKHGLL